MNKLQKYLLLASFIGTFAGQMLVPLYGIFVIKMGGGILDAGIGFAIFAIITGFVIIVCGRIRWFSDNTHLLVLLGFLFAGLGEFSYFFVTGMISLFIVQVVNGISVGLLGPAWDTIYTSSVEEGGEHKSWSLWAGGVEIATGLAALLGAYITWRFGFRTMFIATGLFDLISVYFAYLVYKNRDKK